MKNKILNLGLLFLSLVSAQAFAHPGTYPPDLLSDANWDVQIDSNGMPYCLQPKNPSLGAISLDHKRQDPYMGSVAYEFIDRFPSSKNLGRPARCEDANRAKLLPRKIGWKPFEDDRSDFYGKPLPEKFLASIHQLKWGALRYRDQTPEEFVRNQIPEFTLGINRKITWDYNVEFASAVYKFWQEHHGANASFKGRVDAYLGRTAHGELDDPGYLKKTGDELQDRLGHPVVMVARYLGADTKSGGEFQPLLDDLASYGYEVELLDFKPYNSVDANAALIKKGLDRKIAEGRPIILLGASKGTTDALTALANEHGSLESPDRPSGAGSLIAFVNISGTIQGSRLADAAFSDKIATEALNALSKFYMREVKHEVGGGNLDAFSDLSTREISKRMEWVRPQLPQKTVYMNVTAVIPGQGLAKGPYIRKVQDQMLRKYAHRYGASDVWVEFPGSAIPEDWAKHVVSLVTDSSHIITDGNYAGLSLSDPKQRRRVFLAWFQALTDEIEAAAH